MFHYTGQVSIASHGNGNIRNGLSKSWLIHHHCGAKKRKKALARNRVQTEEQKNPPYPRNNPFRKDNGKITYQQRSPIVSKLFQLCQTGPEGQSISLWNSEGILQNGIQKSCKHPCPALAVCYISFQLRHGALSSNLEWTFLPPCTEGYTDKRLPIWQMVRRLPFGIKRIKIVTILDEQRAVWQRG